MRVGSRAKSQQWDIMKWFCHVFRRFAACGYIKARLCYKWAFIGRLASTVVKFSFRCRREIRFEHNFAKGRNIHSYLECNYPSLYAIISSDFLRNADRYSNNVIYLKSSLSSLFYVFIFKSYGSLYHHGLPDAEQLPLPYLTDHVP